jgi:hypothetical protein
MKKLSNRYIIIDTLDGSYIKSKEDMRTCKYLSFTRELSEAHKFQKYHTVKAYLDHLNSYVSTYVLAHIL